MAESQAFTQLGEPLYEEPSQLSQALLLRAGSRRSLNLSASPESVRQLVSDTPVLRRRAHAHTRRAASHDSAVTNTMDPMRPIYPSFAAMADSFGDTQPDSQMHADFAVSSRLSTIHMPPSLTRGRSLFDNDDDDVGDAATATDENDDDDIEFAKGHAEVITSSQNRADAALTSPTALDDDRPAYTHTAQDDTSPLKFATPAPAGPKRESSDAFSSAARTESGAASRFPGIANSTFGQPLSLTQAFDLTQARTSPIVDGVADDIVFQRPSPNFARPCHSSPMPVLSSPTKMMPNERSDPVMRSSSEPRSEYVTMKESQERRRQIAGSHRVHLVQQDSWEEPSALQKRMQRQKAKELSHREAGILLANISAPARPNQKQGKGARGAVSRSAINGDGADDAHDSGEDPVQPVAIEDDGENSLDELSQETPATGTQDSRHYKVQVPGTSSHRHHTPHDASSHNPSPGGTQMSGLQYDGQLQASASQPMSRSNLRPHSSRDSVAVMDSQPDALTRSQSVPRPKSLRYPSSPSTMQYSINQTTIATKTGYTSQFVSSSVPMPPRLSQPLEEDLFEEEERVPSSPPLLPPDKDLMYDEHTYDEHSEKDGHEHDIEPTIVDDDVEMGDDDDLPIAKPEQIDEDEVLDDTQPNDIGEHNIDHGPGEEVPESLEQDNGIHQEASYPVPHLRRQNTIPETDACDDTQPSHFSERRLDPFRHIEMETPIHTSGTETSQAVQEQHMISPSSRKAPTLREDGSDTIQEGPRIRSLHDIANLPDTQRSNAEEEIEMPRLSGVDELEDDTFIANSPPQPSATKKQRLTHSVPEDTTSIEQVAPPMESTQGREELGALAAAHARQEIQSVYGPTATLKTKATSRPTKSKAQRKGALKPVREILDVLSSPIPSPSKPKAVAALPTKSPVSPTRPSTAQTDVDMADADDTLDELATSPPPPNVNGAAKNAPVRAVTPIEDVPAPNRIFASWPGSHFYPATCIGRSDSRHLQVRFDDSNTTFLDITQVRALDLRVGDQVKVDETGMKKHTYVVVGLKDKLAGAGGDEYPMTDKYGHMTAILEEKQRDSMVNGAAAQPAAPITVPIASIYLTTQLLSRLRDRSFTFSPLSSPKKAASHVGTPLTTEALNTPSFTRRGTALPSFLKTSTTRAGSVSSSGRLSSNLFSNMAFVLTSTAEDMDKDAISKDIKANGGRVLEVGFHELFEERSSEISSPQDRSTSESASDLALKEDAKQLGFVALITDSHSRSTKYLQALALNVPCLHLRWIQDSLRASRALHFAKYLLPAGVSTYLDPHGTVRSRTISTYDPTTPTVSFPRTLLDRDLLLANQSVLLVTGKAKKDIERRQPFVFLTHALGSAHVGRCADLSAAAQMLRAGAWDWVYVDNGPTGVGDAASALFGTAAKTKSKKKGKKRKRGDSEEGEGLVERGVIEGRVVRVTCAEFVIQSLILGALVE